MNDDDDVCCEHHHKLLFSYFSDILPFQSISSSPIITTTTKNPNKTT
jgi:hypothetical protein